MLICTEVIRYATDLLTIILPTRGRLRVSERLEKAL